MIPIPIKLLVRLLKALNYMNTQGAKYPPDDPTLMEELDGVLAVYDNARKKLT